MGKNYMYAAIKQLRDSLENLEIREPICRADGRTEQADRDFISIGEIRQAIRLLTEPNHEIERLHSVIASANKYCAELYTEMARHRETAEALKAALQHYVKSDISGINH